MMLEVVTVFTLILLQVGLFTILLLEIQKNKLYTEMKMLELKRELVKVIVDEIYKKES